MTEQAAANNNIVIGFPLYEDGTLLDFVGATQVFAFAGGCTPIWLAKEKKPILSSEGMTVNPQYAFSEEHPPIDVLFVPGGGGDGVAAAMLDHQTQQWITEVAQHAQWSGSVCVGAFILAAAKVLDGCNVTTYWSALEILQRFPELQVFTNSYPRYLVEPVKRRFSGGGVSSSIDLALELVIQLKGTIAADNAQLSIQYAPDPPVESGDPSTAAPELVEQMRKNQAQPFLHPISVATDQVINQ